jgi:hypothetical protein
MATNLTPKTIANLKVRPTAYFVNDTVRTGLALRIPPSGERSWSLRYRVGKRQRRLTLGSLTVLSLADARQAARDALKKVARGEDPAETKVERREGDTVADDYPHGPERRASLCDDYSGCHVHVITLTIGSVTLRLNMRREEALALLAPLLTSGSWGERVCVDADAATRRTNTIFLNIG